MLASSSPERWGRSWLCISMPATCRTARAFGGPGGPSQMGEVIDYVVLVAVPLKYFVAFSYTALPIVAPLSRPSQSPLWKWIPP
jgi:hypothetical protein